MAALTQFDLSYAYPFMSLSFVLVLVFSVVLFGETATAPRIIGILLILAGIAVGSRG
jgi:multidrug transporter EmrE-like cation transporter